jgi:hypothetical protein
MLDYVADRVPPINCLVGGVFNVQWDTFKSGSPNLHQEKDVATCAETTSMGFVHEPGF